MRRGREVVVVVDESAGAGGEGMSLDLRRAEVRRLVEEVVVVVVVVGGEDGGESRWVGIGVVVVVVLVVVVPAGEDERSEGRVDNGEVVDEDETEAEAKEARFN